MSTPAERRLKYKGNIRQKYYELKEASVCAHCGLSGKEHADRLQFHHIHPRGKTDNVAHLVQQAQSWKYIQKEIKKCIVLCDECHKQEHRRLGLPDPRNIADAGQAVA